MKVAVLKEGNLVHEVLNFDCGCYEVYKELEVVDSLKRIGSLARHERRSLDDLDRLLPQRISENADMSVSLRHDIIKITHSANHIRLILKYCLKLETLVSLKDGSHGTVRHLESLYDLRNCTICIEILLGRILDRKVVLRNSSDEGVAPFSIFDKTDGFLPSDCYREYRAREEHGISQGKNRQSIRQLRLINLGHTISLHHRNDAHFCSRC